MRIDYTFNNVITHDSDNCKSEVCSHRDKPEHQTVTHQRVIRRDGGVLGCHALSKLKSPTNPKECQRHRPIDNLRGSNCALHYAAKRQATHAMQEPVVQRAFQMRAVIFLLPKRCLRRRRCRGIDAGLRGHQHRRSWPGRTYTLHQVHYVLHLLNS